MNKYAETIEIIKKAIEVDGDDAAVLFYSAGGKDGIVLLDLLSKFYKKVICVYMYLIPNLSHTDKYILWAKKNYNTEIIALPHYQRTIMKKNGFYCIPIDEDGFYSQREVEDFVRTKLNKKIIYNGMKGVDGYMKRMRLKMYAKNGYRNNQGVCFPLANWTNKECMRYIKSKMLIEPFSYDRTNGSQGLVLKIKELLYLRENYRCDYDKILKDFPFCEKIICDYERIQASGDRESYEEYTSLCELQPKKNKRRSQEGVEG